MYRVLIILLACISLNAGAMSRSESFALVRGQLDQSKNADISIIIELKDSGFIIETADQELKRSANAKSVMMKKLKAMGVREHRRYKHLPLMALEVNDKSLDEVKNIPGIKKVYLNQLRKHFLSSSTKQVQADQAWARSLSGQGQTVAVVDAGLRSSHDMFDVLDDNSFIVKSGKVISEACFTTTVNISGIQLFGNCWPDGAQMRIGSGSASPGGVGIGANGNDHGTRVGSVIAGQTYFTNPIRRGVAINSNVIAVNVFSRVRDFNVCGYTSLFDTNCVVALDSDILAGLDHVYSLRNSYNIAAVNLSLGSGAFQNACDGQSAYTSIVNRFHSAGIAVIAAAGNEGSSVTVSEPACVSKVIAVGSVDDDNVVSEFSNSNSLIDFWAPGENITTADGGSRGYVTVAGTSFSAPHVSAAFAILKSYNKKLTVDEITTLLQTSGLQITDSMNAISRPLIQINNALDITPRGVGLTPLILMLLLEE